MTLDSGGGVASLDEDAELHVEVEGELGEVRARDEEPLPVRDGALGMEGREFA